MAGMMVEWKADWMVDRLVEWLAALKAELSVPQMVVKWDEC